MYKVRLAQAKIIAIPLVLAAGVASTYAQVPIIDATTSNTDNNSRQTAVGGSPVRTLPLNDTAARALPDNSSAMVYQLETLQQEVQELRGMVEQLSYQLERMREDQRDRYRDLDRRISMGGGSSSPALGSETEEPFDAMSATQRPAAGATGQTGQVTQAAPQAGEDSAYQAAFNLIRDKRYDDAITALNNFTQRYPDGEYAGNAYYWLGEVYLVKSNYEEALKSFGFLLNRFPAHRKAAGAKYKLGKAYVELGETERARRYLRDVISQHPGSSEAQLAEIELRNLPN